MKLRHVVGVLLAAVLATVSLSAAAVCRGFAVRSGELVEAEATARMWWDPGARMLGAGRRPAWAGIQSDGVDDYVHVGMLGNIGVNRWIRSRCRCGSTLN